jgi:hypothetical protein
LVLPPPLAAEDADAALAAYLALPALPATAATTAPAEFSGRLSRLRALLTLLPPAHFEKLFAALATRVGDAEARLRRAAFAVWTEIEAPAAARWAAAVVPGEAINASARERYASTAVLAWADTAFDPAFAWVNALDDQVLRNELATDLLADLVTTDPARALALAQTVGDEFFASARSRLFRAWSAKDPAAAVQSLGAGLLERSSDSWPVREALGNWFKKDPAKAFAWIIAQPPETESHRQSLLASLSWQIGRDPATARAASDLLVAHPEAHGRWDALRQLAGHWASQDPGSARAWLVALPDTELRADLVERSLNRLKPEDALSFAQLLPEGPNRTDRIADKLEAWAATAPDQALAWLAAHDSPEFTPAVARVQGALLANLAKTDPSAALLRWQSLDDPASKNASVSPLALAWSRTDPAAAARWLAPFLANSASHPDARNTFRTVTGRLASTDPQALLTLAETLPDESLREELYNTLAQDSFYDATDHSHKPSRLGNSERVRLLSSISDEKTRASVLQSTVRDWLMQDFNTARAWLDANDYLTPEQAAELISQTNPLAP